MHPAPSSPSFLGGSTSPHQSLLLGLLVFRSSLGLSLEYGEVENDFCHAVMRIHSAFSGIPRKMFENALEALQQLDAVRRHFLPGKCFLVVCVDNPCTQSFLDEFRDYHRG
jgi:hypothetical protein